MRRYHNSIEWKLENFEKLFLPVVAMASVTCPFDKIYKMKHERTVGELHFYATGFFIEYSVKLMKKINNKEFRLLSLCTENFYHRIEPVILSVEGKRSNLVQIKFTSLSRQVQICNYNSYHKVLIAFTIGTLGLFI